MAVTGIDHIAIPTSNAERLIAFYIKLGFYINDEKWREGQSKIFSIKVGQSKINVHPEGHTPNLRGPSAIPGCGDICFVWQGTVDACVDMLNEAEIEIISCPAPRAGAQSERTAVSVYARDPDDNLLEWMIYLDEEMSSE